MYHKAYFSQWAQAEAVRMAHPPFSYEKDNTERFVVQDELRIGFDNPMQQLRSIMANTAFNRSGYSVVSTKQTAFFLNRCLILTPQIFLLL